MFQGGMKKISLKNKKRHLVNTYCITSFKNVCIQVRPVRYQSQPVHDPHGYNPIPLTINATITGLDLCSCQTKLLIQALNATQGHKPS